MECDEIKRLLDQMLDEMGYAQYLNIKYGRIVLEVNFEDGKGTLVVKERNLQRLLKPHNHK